MMHTKEMRTTGPPRTNTSISLIWVSEQESLIKALTSQKKCGILLVQKGKWDIRVAWTMEMRLAEIQGIPTSKVHRRTHDCHVVQWAADGQVAVGSHG